VSSATATGDDGGVVGQRASAGALWIALRGVRKVVKVLAPFVLLVGLWQLTAMLLGLSSYLFPRPADVATAFWELSREGILPAYIADSMKVWFIGVMSGAAVGMGVGFVLAFSGPLRALVMPGVRFFNSIAELAWLPLVILWFQFGFTTLVFIIWYTVVFPVLLNALTGIEAVPTVTRQAVRSLGASRLQLVREVLLPGALPSLVAGFRIGAGYAFRALIVAEAFAASSGVGYLIFQSRETGLVNRTMVGMLVFGLIWIAIDRFFLRPIEVATVERWGLSGSVL
jgi:ABC-type nitrate/sulfonate/bicarbonate transport system permease component